MPTNSPKEIILAIAPGKREFGVAVFAGVDLIYASVKTVGHRKSGKSLLEEVTVILRKLLGDFSIRTVVIKSASQHQKLSPELEKIIGRIRLEAARKDLETAEITLEEIKSELGKAKKTGATEKKAFRKIITIYPELRRYWNRPNKWQRDYYAFLFSAVAAGAVFLKVYSRM